MGGVKISVRYGQKKGEREREGNVRGSDKETVEGYRLQRDGRKG